jgi:hypothetical protein
MMKSIIVPLLCVAGFAGQAFAQNRADLERCSASVVSRNAFSFRGWVGQGICET